MSNLKLTKEEYRNLFDDLERIVEVACESNECISCPLKRKGICIKADVEVGFEQLINEHFELEEKYLKLLKMWGMDSNPPLKFEELKDEMVIWDNLQKEYIKCYEFFNGQWLYLRFGNEEMYVFVFEENRFYRYEVQDETN